MVSPFPTYKYYIAHRHFNRHFKASSCFNPETCSGIFNDFSKSIKKKVIVAGLSLCFLLLINIANKKGDSLYGHLPNRSVWFSWSFLTFL